MKNLRKLVLTMLVMVATSFTFAAQAECKIGYIDYRKVQDNYPYAQSVAKQVDARALELQKYLALKEKQFKAMDTPLKKQNFEEKTKKEFEVKQNAYVTFKLKKEEEIYNRIQTAAKKVLVEQKLDAIIDYRVVFVGGVDITNLVIAKLRTAK